MKIIISPGPTFLWNPFFGLFNDEITRRGHELVAPRVKHVFDADVLHLHFPEHKVSVYKSLLPALINSSMMLGLMLAMRLRGKPVVWMVHDVLPLRRYHPRLCAFYMAQVRRLVTGYVFLSQSSRQQFDRMYPDQKSKPAINVLHPPYPVRLLSTEEKVSVRQRLGVKPDEFLVGYLGDIKPYKNPDILRHVPEKLEDGRETVLLVAGQPDVQAQEFEKYIAGRLHIRIEKRISDEDLESFVQSVDFVLLPYAWGWNSGFLFLVLTCIQKSLTSNLPVFLEMQEYFGNRWVTLFDLKAADMKAAIGKAINDIAKITCGEDDVQRLKGQLKEASFPRLLDEMLAFYNKLGGKEQAK